MKNCAFLMAAVCLALTVGLNTGAEAATSAEGAGASATSPQGAGASATSPKATGASAQAPSDAPPADCEKLKSEYLSLRADRDNILAQAKQMLGFRAQQTEFEQQLKKALEDKVKLKADLDARLEQITLLQQKLEELQATTDEAVSEKETLKNSLEKTKIEYKIIPETRLEITRLQKESADCLRRIKQEEAKVRQIEDTKLDALAQAESYRRQLNDFKKRYEEALVKNRTLEKRSSETPARFAELARENKVLVKQTALMHYNLGVFYTQNKEYSRAAAEFEKAIELNPEDPYAYYNLGYIYAEYLVNRPRAIENFRQFLRLTKSDDKDVDWVKKYILTWQTWEGKKPVE